MNKWTIDPSHTDAGFSVKHMGIMNVRGSFRKAEGFVELNDNNELISAEAIIDITSIASRDKDRDGHLLSEDFFNADKFPTMKFTSNKIVKINAHEYDVVGNITIRGITKEVTISTTLGREISDPFGLRRIALEGNFEIDRQDFEMKWNKILDNGGLLVGNKVKITIDSEVTLEK